MRIIEQKERKRELNENRRVKNTEANKCFGQQNIRL
jgi:hypothetical protein